MAKERKKRKNKHDWELIEQDYRAGHLSLRQIGKRHDISEAAIRKHAKLFGLQRDLAERIRRVVSAKLARAEAKPNISDEEIIDTVSNCGVKIVTAHRSNILKQRVLSQLLADQLGEFSESRDKIEETIVEETKEDADKKRRNQMLKAVSLPSHAGVLRDLSASLKNLIPLERQAYNLGDSGVSLEEVLNALPREFGDTVRRALGRIVSEEGDQGSG